jgi:hypothetical protein
VLTCRPASSDELERALVLVGTQGINEWKPHKEKIA